MNHLKRKIKEASSARSHLNPLRGISIRRVVGYLEAGERGEYCDLQWLFRMIEKRDAVIRALIRRRAAALLKLSWDIKQIPKKDLPEGSTEAQAAAQALALRTLYDGIGNLKDAIKFLALAEFRGYSHLEKSFNNSRSPDPARIDELAPIHQWFWCRDGLDGTWKFDPDLQKSYQNAEEVPSECLIVREVDDPVNEIGLIAFLRKGLSQKDWDGFIEVFGIPDIFFVMPEGLSLEQQAEWQTTSERLAGDGRGGLPAGSDVKVVGGDVRGTNPFLEHLEYQDAMVVLAGTGGKLTMLSEATGLGGGATAAHEDAFDDLAKAEAAEISEILQQSLDAPLLAAQFAGQPTLAYFEIAAKDEEDITALIQNALTLFQAGIEIDVDDLAVRTGYALSRLQAILGTGDLKATEAAAAPAAPKTKNRRSLLSRLINRKTTDPVALLKKNSRVGIAQAIALDYRPIAASLAAVLDDTPDDDALFQALVAWQTNTLPQLVAEVIDDPSAAAAYEESLTAALLNGYFAKDAADA